MNVIMGIKFEREFKKLAKKYHTLADDMDTLIYHIKAIPLGNESKHWNILKQDGKKYILKVRLKCRTVQGSDFRVIYYYDGEKIELILIEIYFKGDKETQDKKRIDKFWQEKTNDSFEFPANRSQP